MEHKHAEPINKWKFVTRRVSKKEHVININRNLVFLPIASKLHSLLSLTLTLLLSVMMMMTTTTLDIICDERGH